MLCNDTDAVLVCRRFEINENKKHFSEEPEKKEPEKEGPPAAKTDLTKAKAAAAQSEAAEVEWADAQLGNLSEEQSAYCKSVKKVGLGLCSRCRWSTGCDRCSYIHSVKYWLKKGPEAKMATAQKTLIIYGL